MDAHTPQDNGDASLQLYACWDDEKHHQIFNFLYTGTVSKSGHPQFAGQIQSKFVDALDSCFKPFATLGGPTEIHMGKCDADNKEMMFTIWDYKSKTGAKTNRGPLPVSIWLRHSPASPPFIRFLHIWFTPAASASASISAPPQPLYQPLHLYLFPPLAQGIAHPPMAKESGIDYAQRLEERAAKQIVSAVQNYQRLHMQTSWKLCERFTYPTTA